MEASESLGLEDVNGPRWDEVDEQKKVQEKLKKTLADLKDSKGVYGEILHDCDNQLELWDDLRDKIEDGRTVYTPSTKKRKAPTRNKSSKKRTKTSRLDEDDDDFIVDDDDYDEDASDSDQSEGNDASDRASKEPLTLEQIVAKIAEIKATKKQARRQRADLDLEMKKIREQVEAAKNSERKAEAAIAESCILGRNQYSKGAIQNDFAGESC